jgi:putative serine protease PepD
MTQTDNRSDGWPRAPWTSAAVEGDGPEGSGAPQPEQAAPDQQPDHQPVERADQQPVEQADQRPAEQPDQQGAPAPAAEQPDQQSTQQIPPYEQPYAQPSGYPQSGYPQSGYPQSGYPQSGYQQSGYQQYGGYPQPAAEQTAPYPYSTAHPTAGQPPQPPAGGSFTRPREPRRGPGWFGVATVGVGSALVASLLTAGLVNQNDTTTTSSGTTSSSAPSSATAPQQSGPVTSSSSKLPDWGAVAAAVEPSVVAVKVSGQSGSGEGSGVILNAQGNVLTNNHVVAEASGGGQIEVVLSDGRGYKATVVGTDPQTDVAVIKITSPPSGLKPATLGDSSAVKVGDPVMAVGNPLGLSDTVTTGIVSAVDRPVTTGGQSQDGTASADTVFTNAIQTDAAINPGNSGGALVDAQGRLIGINSSIASLGSSSIGGQQQSGNIGLGFAIPVNEVKGVADQLIKSGKVEHAYLGVSLQDGSVTLDGAQRQTAQIGQVNANTPASKAGLKAGDQVIAIDGDQVFGADSLIAQVRERSPDQSITLTVVRNGSSQDIKLVLGTRPTG